MVRQWQDIFLRPALRRHAAAQPNFVKIADAYDIPAVAVSRKEDVEAAIRRARAHRGPFLIEFKVEPFANVFPHGRPGKSNADMIRRPLPAVTEETGK